jgi:hypothetical protein
MRTKLPMGSSSAGGVYINRCILLPSAFLLHAALFFCAINCRSCRNLMAVLVLARPALSANGPGPLPLRTRSKGGAPGYWVCRTGDQLALGPGLGRLGGAPGRTQPPEPMSSLCARLHQGAPQLKAFRAWDKQTKLDECASTSEPPIR